MVLAEGGMKPTLRMRRRFYALVTWGICTQGVLGYVNRAFGEAQIADAVRKRDDFFSRFHLKAEPPCE